MPQPQRLGHLLALDAKRQEKGRSQPLFAAFLTEHGQMLDLIRSIVLVAGMLASCWLGAYIYQRGLANLPLTDKFPNLKLKRNSPQAEALREARRQGG